MGYWTEQDLPFYHGLARTFPLADRWFSSCLGPTFPNRRFLLAGTTNGLMDDLPLNLIDRPRAGTITEMLTRHGISWVNYRPSRRPVPVPSLPAVPAPPAPASPDLLRPAAATDERGVQAGPPVHHGDLPARFRGLHGHVRSVDQFFADADSGNLPSFCIVDPDFRSFSEENPQDIRKGESFAAEVINRVMHGPGWADTLLIWTYNGRRLLRPRSRRPRRCRPTTCAAAAFSPTRPGLPRTLLKLLFPGYVRHAEELVAGPDAYDTYGFRVPAVIVSPYAPAELRPFRRVRPHLGAQARRGEVEPARAHQSGSAAAIAPLGALDLAAPPAFLTPPELPRQALEWGSWSTAGGEATRLRWDPPVVTRRRAHHQRAGF